MKILFKELLKYKLSLFFLLVATYVSTTFELLIPLLLANALNVGIVQNYGLEYIKNIAIMMFSAIIIGLILNIIIHFLITKTSTHIATNIRNNLFSKTLSLKNSEFQNFSHASLITRTNQDCEQIKHFTTSLLSTIFKAPIILYSCIFVLKTLSKDFFIVITIAIIILITFLMIIVLKLIPLSKKIQLSIDNLNKNLTDKINNFKLIKSYNNLEYENDKFNKTSTTYLKTSKRIIKITSLINPCLTLIVNTITIIILILCVNKVKSNTIEVGTVIATIQYILQFLLSIIMISMIFISIPTIKVSLNRINDVLKSQSYTENEEIKEIDIESITYNNLSFSYSTNNKLLENITFTINKGENIGIIGLNGSGKSTLFKILLKEYEIPNNTIKINNLDINTLSRKDITNNLTYLSQKPYLLKGTILENIAFANKSLTMPDIAKIIHTCNLENFISEKKEKINYIIEENGANLSGGQKQRISLARALAKNNSLIILDEPFSALDYKTEKEIITKLNTYYKDKTFVTISQRISSIINCSKILVLDKGKILDFGTHTQLLERCTLYKEIYNTQKEVIEYDL